jgi:hypothetical protein
LRWLLENYYEKQIQITDPLENDLAWKFYNSRLC